MQISAKEYIYVRNFMLRVYNGTERPEPCRPTHTMHD